MTLSVCFFRILSCAPFKPKSWVCSIANVCCALPKWLLQTEWNLQLLVNNYDVGTLSLFHIWAVGGFRRWWIITDIFASIMIIYLSYICNVFVFHSVKYFKHIWFIIFITVLMIMKHLHVVGIFFVIPCHHKSLSAPPRATYPDAPQTFMFIW